ncbi:YveK family protein [Marinococcus halotolerans]|uniref:YveK family protein n=1 Tax=Marinococcus halotolerans TaxID=301092 RepID=UPI0003B400B5|nr:Wzz/FepE/Etk N-terminal domain-containing protein [Marinococcus halotolerans]
MEETISLQELFQTLKKRIGLIIAITLLGIIISAIVTYFIMTPQYQASTQVLVNQSQVGEEPITSQELQSNREFINTYSVIMASPTILEPVIQEIGLNDSVGELREKITISAEEESQVANITVEDSNPETAVTIANTLATIFEQQIPEIMDVDNVSILSEAQMENSNSPISPQPTLNLVLGFVIGLMVGIGLAFLLDFLDKTVKTEQDVEKEIGLPILGIVPIMSDKDLSKFPNENITERKNK